MADMTRTQPLWEYPEMALDTPTGQAFYARLIEAFKDADLSTTQTSIAAFLNINQSAVAKWKSGESFPSWDNVVKLAQRANVSVTWLYLGSGDKHEMDEQTKKMLDAWHEMSESARAELLEYLQFRAASQRKDRDADTP